MDTDATIAANKEAAVQDEKPEQVSDYFAACPTEEIARELQAKVDKYYVYVHSANLVELWRRSYRAYYGMRQNVGNSGWGVFDVGQLIASGDQGEICRVKVNHHANLITHQLVMTTSSRPAVECRAVNSDAESLVAAQLGDGIGEYVLREKKLERYYFQAIEISLVTGEGYIVLGWDPNAGKQYGVGPNGAPVFDGDLKAKNFTPFNMIKEVTKTSNEEQTWYITHGTANKYDLMAKYPSLADEIAKVSPDETTATSRTFADPSKIIAATSFGTQQSDDVPYMEFYHKVTDSMPQGRYTIFINGDICLFDGPLPFREMPVYRVTPREIIGTPFGWTIAFDILALQELIDKLYTIVSTNAMTAGVNNFWSPPNNGVTVSQLGGAGNLIESITKPEVLQMLQTAPELYRYIDKVEQVMETLAGVSAINRGDVPSSDMSGSAMAFMASQAITFSSGLQQSANQLLESMMTGVINILKDFAATPRMAIIAGKQNRPQMKMFMGKDLEPINNVVCDATSALSKTTAGKISIADNLLKAGQVNGHEYLTLIKTGNMEPMTRGKVLEGVLIQLENEELLQGQKPPVLKIDNHAQHIDEHKSLLASPSSRRDPKIVIPTLAHIADHEAEQQRLQQTDPAFLAATGQAPLPFPAPPTQPGPPPGAPGAPPGGPPPPGAAAGIPGTVNPANPLAQKASEVRGPHMPNLPKGTDPQTAESYAKVKGAA